MTELQTAICVGKLYLVSRTNGKTFCISHFTYDLKGNKAEGQGTFTTFDDVPVGQPVDFVMNNGKATLILS